MNGKSQVNPKINPLFFIFAIPFTLYLINYYYTGIGGPLMLAVIMVPYAFIIHVLDSLRNNKLYPRLGIKVNYIVAAIYVTLCILVAAYLYKEFYPLNTIRFGSYNTYDLLIGAIMFIFVMEYSRRRHPALFVLNLFLIFYAFYGRIFPGMFSHPGLGLTRIISAMSVEFETGVFERLPQLALTLIGAFILLISVAQGFGCIQSIISWSSSIASKSVQGIPQSAVLGSMCVATVSGSGAANAAATGSFTIPLMVKIGLPRRVAGAIETAASLGGQLMPPMMGVSAFIMSDFLGVTYFDVVARGYIPAIIYYVGIALGVYLLSYRYLGLKRTSSPTLSQSKVEQQDKVNVAIFFSGLAVLIYLMGGIRMPAIYAALITTTLIFILLLLSLVYYSYRKHNPNTSILGRIRGSLLQSVERFTTLTSDLTLLLATLGIMTGVFTITGVPTKIGLILMEVGRANILLLVAITLAFGYFVGLGLPPSATYIITAVVIASHMIKLGFNPWVVHFYAFFIGVFSELSPPTSVTAAVASRISGASFMRTMFEAMKICVPLYVLMFTVLVRQDLVIEPGALQILTGGMVAAGTIGFSFSLLGKYSRNLVLDIPLRALLALASSIVVFHPDINLASLALIPTVGLSIYGIYRFKKLYH